MLNVKTPDEVYRLVAQTPFVSTPVQMVPLAQAGGRVLAKPILAGEYVPGFHRSTVDGYAVAASDTFGASETIPAILEVAMEIQMGKSALGPLRPGCCAAIPTGGALPQGADAAVMMEHTEDYQDGTVGIYKPVAPGENVIFKGDDICPGKEVLAAGCTLGAKEIGALAAMGILQVPVRQRPRVAILSTGDELVPVEQLPGDGQVRDVNGAMLAALCQSLGAEPLTCGIVADEAGCLETALEQALVQGDMVLISGGSSVGSRDATFRAMEAQGPLLCHGIAMKPGKPTIMGSGGGKPILGLPGHPAAAFFVAELFLPSLLARLTGQHLRRYMFPAKLAEMVSANHGRAQYMGVRITGTQEEGFMAHPIHGKSGLISLLADSEGYFCIPRDCEGMAAGETVYVIQYS